MDLPSEANVKAERTFQGRAVVLGRAAQALALRYGTPLYVYDSNVIHANVARIRASIDYAPLAIHYACMANGNVHLLREMRHSDVGIFVCGPGELVLAQAAGYETDQIVANSGNLSTAELNSFAAARVTVNADSHKQVKDLLRTGFNGSL